MGRGGNGVAPSRGGKCSTAKQRFSDLDTRRLHRPLVGETTQLLFRRGSGVAIRTAQYCNVKMRFEVWRAWPRRGNLFPRVGARQVTPACPSCCARLSHPPAASPALHCLSARSNPLLAGSDPQKSHINHLDRNGINHSTTLAAVLRCQQMTSATSSTTCTRSTPTF
jgi:hypothetical protein